MDWITANIGTIIVCLVLAAIIGVIVFSMIRGRKKGKSPCGCDCRCCPNKCYKTEKISQDN